MKSLRKEEQSLPMFLKNQLIYRLYRLTVPWKVRRLRKKDKIKVVFVVSQLGFWKSENLYLKMLAHPRFEPVILVIKIYERIEEYNRVIEHLTAKGYDFIPMEDKKSIREVVRPDIIFYVQPYYGVIHPRFDFLRNLQSLFCYVYYAFHTLNDIYLEDQPFFSFCWQVYFENEIAKENSAKMLYNGASNAVVSGLPFVDDYFTEVKSDPWKTPKGEKKRIIWAPHHSLPGSGHLAFSTFLTYCDFMLEMADKYRESVQFVFKPHPALESKLFDLWGREKTEAYYERWRSGENTQLENGQYTELFKSSDAMIHDCVSFSIEYHYTCNPVMMLESDDALARKEVTNDFGRMAYDLHYIGKTKEDVEAFIVNVIEGRDEMGAARRDFYEKYLLPPDGSACESIIKNILGE